MPSSSKTSHYKLNQWSGSDFPKRDDWNSDNSKLDTALIDLDTAVKRHGSESARHVSSQERVNWNGMQHQCLFSYTGTGTSPRTISLDKKPNGGFLFAVDYPTITQSPTVKISFGFFSQYGCSEGISVVSNGLVVNHQTLSGKNGTILNYNQNNVKYICVYW